MPGRSRGEGKGLQILLKIQKSGRLTTLSGTAILGLLRPLALFSARPARAGAGDLFVTDAVHHSVVVYVLDGTMRTVRSRNGVLEMLLAACCGPNFEVIIDSAVGKSHYRDCRKIYSVYRQFQRN